MKLASPHRKASAWALALGCALAFVRCADDQVAGSSVTTGNPTEIQVSLTDAGGGPVALSGRVEIYASTQIPIPGFRPEPLARFEVGGDTFTLDAGRFEGIADSLWAKGSLEGDSLAKFNLVITGADKGAILGDMAYRLKDGKFKLNAGTFKAGKAGAAKISALVSGFSAYQATLDSSILGLRRHHYLFIRGTGYFARSDSARFVFPALPVGSHNPILISIPTKESQATSPQDSVELYSLEKPLATGENPTLRGSSLGRISIPSELR